MRTWLPAGRLARLTLYFAALDLLFFLLARLSALLHLGFAATLDGWAYYLTWIAATLAGLLALGWIRRKLLWRLRNRLIVTYTFIGVIPVVLLLAIGIISAYLFAWQFATFVANSDFQSELNTLAAVNSRLTAEVVTRLKEGVPASPRLLQLASLREQSSTGREVTAWYRGKPIVPDSGEQAIAPPPSQAAELRAIVVDGNRILLRAADTVDVSGEKLVVISSTPITHEVLARMSTGLGVLTLVPLEDVEQFPKVQAGTLPAASNTFDREITAPSPLMATDWKTGQTVPSLLIVGTRPSLLYGQLFQTIGEFTRNVYVVLAGVAIVFAFIELLALIIGLRLSRTITRSVAALYDATQHINRGDLNHRIQVKSSDQLAALEGSFNSMTESLQRLLAEQKAKQRLEHELAIAQEVQAQLFPGHISQLPSLEVHGVCQPARTVSGDYYDFLHFGHDRLGIAVGDISGKGISAALLMATIHSAVRAYTLEAVPAAASAQASVQSGEMGGGSLVLATNGLAPAALCRRLNHQLYSTTPEEKYATLFLGLYDAPSRCLTYSNAGHLPPIILRHDGSLRRLNIGGTVIGLFPEVRFDEGEVELAPGDIFVAYSDGVTEPENDFGEFGEERLLDLVRENRSLSLARISEVVTSAVSDWIGGAEQPDDITVVLARAR